jgi:hypothetical protein
VDPVQPGADTDVPDGFDINANLQRGDGWAVKEAGLIVLGRLVGKSDFKGGDGKPRVLYQVRLSKAVKAIIGSGDDAAEGELQPGQLCNVDGSAALAELDKYCNNGGVYDVYVKYLEKRPIGGGQTYWDANVKLKQIKAPSRRGNDDVPF